MITENKKTGIEFSFLNSWEGWDEHGVADLYFYDVTLKPEVFGAEFVEQYTGTEIDFAMWLSQSLIEVYVDGNVVLSKPIKLSITG